VIIGNRNIEHRDKVIDIKVNEVTALSGDLPCKQPVCEVACKWARINLRCSCFDSDSW